MNWNGCPSGPNNLLLNITKTKELPDDCRAEHKGHTVHSSQKLWDTCVEIEKPKKPLCKHQRQSVIDSGHKTVSLGSTAAVQAAIQIFFYCTPPF